MKSLFLLLIGLTMTATAQQPAVEYVLAMPQPWTHLFEVEATFRNISGRDSVLDLRLPVWRTGRYVVFDFASGVVAFSADDGSGNAMEWEKSDKSTWRVHTAGATAVRARYSVYANEFPMRTRGLNDEHGFVDGTSVFMYVERYRKTPVNLTVKPYRTWHVTTGLESVPGNRFRFVADGYDHLVDCPLEIGTQTDVEFMVEGKKHVLSVAGKVRWDQDSVLSSLKRIVMMNKKFWGDLPYDRYLFMFTASPSGGGGTEHMNSAVMGIRPFGYDQPGGYRGWVGLVSHEFFHTWNVKRLRPRGMDPYDWTKENYYRELWIAEGGTSYMHGVLLTRSGLQTRKDFLNGIASSVRADRARPGNTEQSITECSFDAWIKLWRRTEQAYNFETDYYARGANACLLLDLAIRHASENAHSLDDVFREMYRRFPLGGGGYTVDDFQQVAQGLAGTSLGEFFHHYVFGTDSLPWENTLSYAGLKLSPTDTIAKPWIGIQGTTGDRGAEVAQVVAGSPAYEAGVNTGDEIIALDGYRVGARDVEKRIAGYHAKEVARLTVFRDDKLRDVEVKVRDQRNTTYAVEQTDEPTPLQKAIFESWTGLPWEGTGESPENK